jgi:primosomal protein N' (replication factor Y) (superfamily II helicase)
LEVEVALPAVKDQTFTYYSPNSIQPGVRVKVPFAFQGKKVGVVLSCVQDQVPDTRPYKLKSVLNVLEQEPSFSPAQLKLARWLSTYYLHPIGDVFKTMLPATQSKTRTVRYKLMERPQPDADPYRLNSLFNRKSDLTKLQLEKKLAALGLTSDESKGLIKKLLKSKILAEEIDRDTRTRTKSKQDSTSSVSRESIAEPARPLTPSQQQAYDFIATRFGAAETHPSKPILLHGVTGSGKTEVFMHLLSKLFSLDESSQALILVPEISLTPQMTRIFCDRFPGVVAVVHSAMPDHERWSELQRIRNGTAKILIGPRSAVFAGFAKLGLMIIDEEHDSSYKQGNGLLYHARDVAVMRAKIESCPIVLGSATPSMETWYNSKSKKYDFVAMATRVTNRPLPEITTVTATPASRSLHRLYQSNTDSSPNPSDPQQSSLFSEEIIAALKENLDRGQQSIVLLNRRGFAYYLFRLSERKAAQCPRCSISLAVHGRKRTLKCHYCDYHTSIESITDGTSPSDWALVGFGSQRGEEELQARIPQARIARLDSDTVADPQELPRVLNAFKDQKIDILVGTQILAKGHDFPNVTLICILEVDQLLSMPDFRGGERTFQLLVQAAGRSGRGQLTGKVMVQSLRTDHPIVQDALKQDFHAFADAELKFRQQMGYPPFGKMALIEYGSDHEADLCAWDDQLETLLDNLLTSFTDLMSHIKILGPTPAPIEMIRGRHRRNLIILTPHRSLTHQLTQKIAALFAEAKPTISFKIDIDPQSIL